MILSLCLYLYLIIKFYLSGQMIGQWRRVNNSHLPCPYFSIPRYPSLENFAVKFVAGINNLVVKPPFLLISLWSLMINFGSGISRVASNFPTNCSSRNDQSIFTFSINPFASSDRAITLGWRASLDAFNRWLETYR